MDVQGTLAARQHTHGSFEANAEVSQALCSLMREAPAWPRLQPFQREALEMLQKKIARMLTGSTCFVDSARDLVGYSTLMYEGMLKTSGSTDVVQHKIILRNNKWEPYDAE